MSYTSEQIDIALGILSGRIIPEVHLQYFDDAKKLHPEIRSVIAGGHGNPGPDAHRQKAEEILLSFAFDYMKDPIRRALEKKKDHQYPQ